MLNTLGKIRDGPINKPINQTENTGIQQAKN